jgi:hypothetical protein
MKALTRRAVACSACLLSLAMALPVRAQDTPADASQQSKSAPNGAAAILDARTLLADERAAETLVAEGQQQQAEALKVINRQKKIAAFRPAEFEKSLKRAEEIEVAARDRAAAARKGADEAKARTATAKAAVEAAKKANADGDDESRKLKLREKEQDALEKAAKTAEAAAEQAKVAKKHASAAVRAAEVASGLEVVRATVKPPVAAPASNGDAAVEPEPPLNAKELDAQIEQKKVDAVDQWLEWHRQSRIYETQKVVADKARSTAALQKSSGESQILENGTLLSWGIAGSLLRFQTQRSERLPGRVRNFRPRYEFVPGEVGFQFLSEPVGVPWRIQLKNGESLQLMSWGGLLLASLGEDKALERGSLSLAATIVFFKNTIGLGAGFDMYRGIPVLGADGTPGGDTAFTGVLAWAFAQEGEVTAENAFFVVTANLSKLAEVLSGKEDNR